MYKLIADWVCGVQETDPFIDAQVVAVMCAATPHSVQWMCGSDVDGNVVYAVQGAQVDGGNGTQHVGNCGTGTYQPHGTEERGDATHSAIAPAHARELWGCAMGASNNGSGAMQFEREAMVDGGKWHTARWKLWVWEIPAAWHGEERGDATDSAIAPAPCKRSSRTTDTTDDTAAVCTQVHPRAFATHTPAPATAANSSDTEVCLPPAATTTGVSPSQT